jgi:pyruvate/2-oxoacid:ferredoxin oxidoreductase beta subunit
MVAHDIPYVATASPAYLEDYARKLTKAMNVKDGMSYIHILTPCPTGWGFPIDKSIDVGKLAVETNYFPLWEYEQGTLRLTYENDKPQPISDYTKLMGRYRHMNENELQQLQKLVDKRFNKLGLYSQPLLQRGAPHV